MEIDKIIAGNLKRIREQKNLTLAQLSEKTGLSKVMLTQLEKGGGNPTINTIWKIAHALDVPYTAILDSTGGTAAIIKGHELPMQPNDEGNYRIRCYYSSSGERNFEWFQMELDAGTTYRSDGHGAHTFEYIIVEEGRLDIELKEKIYSLSEGDSISFHASEPHSYINPGASITKAYLINYYPM